MKATSKAIDDKILEANKYADVKRQELTHTITESIDKVQQSAMGEASNLIGKLNLGGGK